MNLLGSVALGEKRWLENKFLLKRKTHVCGLALLSPQLHLSIEAVSDIQVLCALGLWQFIGAKEFAIMQSSS